MSHPISGYRVKGVSPNGEVLVEFLATPRRTLWDRVRRRWHASYPVRTLAYFHTPSGWQTVEDDPQALALNAETIHPYFLNIGRDMMLDRAFHRHCYMQQRV